MRTLITTLVIVYLAGVGVELAPTIRANWNGTTISQFCASVNAALPRALAWPAAVYHSATARG